MGSPIYPRKRLSTLSERFWAKVHKMPSGCWIWMGALHDDYGNFRISRTRTVRAHVFAWQERYGYTGKDKHHTCGNKLCVNTDHLQELDHGEHSRLTRSSPTTPRYRRRACEG